MHVVVFPGWYPSRVDKLSGDFIQRHMESIALLARVSVVIPVKDKSIKKAETVITTNGNCTEYYYYYPSRSSISWLDNFLSFVYYNYTCLKATKGLAEKEKVDLAHLYVIQKNHFVGLILKMLYKIPYVVSEQSTLYVDGRFEKMKGLQQALFRYVFQHSNSFHAVSNYLLSVIKSKLQLSKEGVIIPNVVDQKLFYYNHEQVNDRVTFVHVSNMVQQKNVEGMLQAFAEVKKTNSSFLLNLVGPLPPAISTLIKELGLSKQVIIWNERNYKEVAEIMQQSDVFVFFTRYETFGCVIIEANACGLPVIVSDLDVTRELITKDFNGLFVESENVADLAEKILYAIENRQKFDPLVISLQTRNKFNYERISHRFLEWYSLVVKSQSAVN